MANEKHLIWINEGVARWNRRRINNDFTPNLSNADLAEEEFQRINLKSANLNSANMVKIDLRSSDISEATLTGVIFAMADLTCADFSGSDLSGANLSMADVSGADMRWTNLMSANMSQAILNKTDFRMANLMYVNLRNSDLRSAIFVEANLTLANFKGAKFDEKTDFTGTTLDGAIFDGNIIIENGRVRYLEDKNQPNDNSKNINQQNKTVSNINQLKEQIAAIPVQTVQANIQNNSFLILLQTEMLLQHIDEYREKIRGDNYLGSENPALKGHLLSFFDNFQLETKTIIQKISEHTTEQQAEEVKSWLSRAGDGFSELWQNVPPIEKAISQNIPTVIGGGIATIMVLISGGSISGNSILNSLWAGCAGNILSNITGVKQVAVDKIKQVKKLKL